MPSQSHSQHRNHFKQSYCNGIGPTPSLPRTTRYLAIASSPSMSYVLLLTFDHHASLMRFQVSNIHVISNYLCQLFLISERHQSHHRRISYDEANSHNQDSAGTMRRKGMEIELLCFSNIAQRQDGCLLLHHQ